MAQSEAAERLEVYVAHWKGLYERHPRLARRLVEIGRDDFMAALMDNNWSQREIRAAAK